ncbi:MAG: EamA family transporter RarD [Rhodobacteraceae bacterium]|nr:EamA family transporter RarD [Paracoccaceae bacterium]
MAELLSEDLQMVQQQDKDQPAGLLMAVAAYFMWGLLPFYMKAVDHVPAVEIVAHRIIWAVPVAALVLIALRRTRDLREALRSPRMLAMAAVTAALISVNWAIYVYAVVSGQALQAALGYYINPLFSILLGAALLGERLTRMQSVAVALAAAAVVILTVEAGALPWPALGMLLTFGFYAFFKKWLSIGPNQGFLLEVLILLPFALGYLGYLQATGMSVFLDSWRTFGLLLLAGPVTAIPLIFYANGAKRIRLSTAGILQYIAPTMIFLCAVFAFGEEFSGAKLVAFPMIWAALIVYSVPMLRQMREKP